MPKITNKAGSQGAQNETELRRLTREWSNALEARDIDGMLENYVPDALLFDVKPPYKIVGLDAYRRLWAECFPYFPSKFESEHRDLEFTVGEDVAFCRGLHRIKPVGEDHPAGSTWMRVTVGYQKMDDGWKVVHEHVSIPVDLATGKGAFITDLDAA